MRLLWKMRSKWRHTSGLGRISSSTRLLTTQVHHHPSKTKWMNNERKCKNFCALHRNTHPHHHHSFATLHYSFIHSDIFCNGGFGSVIQRGVFYNMGGILKLQTNLQIILAWQMAERSDKQDKMSPLYFFRIFEIVEIFEMSNDMRRKFHWRRGIYPGKRS